MKFWICTVTISKYWGAIAKFYGTLQNSVVQDTILQYNGQFKWDNAEFRGTTYNITVQWAILWDNAEFRGTTHNIAVQWAI